VDWSQTSNVWSWTSQASYSRLILLSVRSFSVRKQGGTTRFTTNRCNLWLNYQFNILFPVEIVCILKFLSNWDRKGLRSRSESHSNIYVNKTSKQNKTTVQLATNDKIKTNQFQFIEQTANTINVSQSQITHRIDETKPNAISEQREQITTVWVYDSPFRFLVIIGRLIATINCNQWEINCHNQLQSMED